MNNDDDNNLEVRSNPSEEDYLDVITRKTDVTNVQDEDPSASGVMSPEGNESTAESAFATAAASADNTAAVKNASVAAVAAVANNSSGDDNAHFDSDPLEPEHHGVHEEYHMRKTDRQRSFPTTTGSKSSR